MKYKRAKKSKKNIGCYTDYERLFAIQLTFH